MKLMNYPSGNEEFDKWFEETQPDWAAEIKMDMFFKDDVLHALDDCVEALEREDWDGELPSYLVHAREVLNKAFSLLQKS